MLTDIGNNSVYKMEIKKMERYVYGDVGQMNKFMQGFNNAEKDVQLKREIRNKEISYL